MHLLISAAVLPTLMLSFSPVRAGVPSTGTPAEMVASFDALADTILAVRKTEQKLIRSILGAVYAHAEAELGRARAAVKTGDAKAARTYPYQKLYPADELDSHRLLRKP